MTAFISYSGDRETRVELVHSLREHGITPWRDIEDLDLGARTTETIEAELERCSGAILWINDQLLNSAYVTNIELPAIARAARQRHLRIVPVFDGLSPSEAAERVSRFGIEIGDSNGHLVDPTSSTIDTAAAVAARYVAAETLAARHDNRVPIVRLVTYDDTAAHREDAVLNLDWRHRFGDTPLEPDAQVRLRSGLDVATGAVKTAYGATQITIVAKAHLPIAVALGHAFAEPTGCTIAMHRDGITYAIDRQPTDADALLEHAHPQGPIEARAAAIEVAVTRTTEAGVNAYIAEGNRYRERLELVPAEGSSRSAMDDASSCNAWAQQIGDCLTRLSGPSHIERVDLFLACPIELAIAIGWWANATGIVDLLNWTGKAGPYAPMWHLP